MVNNEEQQAIEYIKFKTITGLETLQLEKDVKALEILLNYIDTLQKENNKYIDIFNSTEKIMNGQERTKDKLLKENVELQKQLDKLKEVDRQICCEELITKDKYQDILKENEELKVEIKKQYKQYIKDHTEVIENLKKDSISKNKIREIVEKSYNDIDYFNRDIRHDLEDLLGDSNE